MQVTFQQAGAVSVGMVHGRLDSNTAAGAEREVLEAIAGGAARIVLDLADVDYVSSAGLRSMLVIAKRLKQADGRFVICAMQPHVEEVFDISGLLSIMTILPTREEAITAAA